MQNNLGVFDAVSIKVAKANISQHAVTYTITVSNKDTHATVTTAKSDDDFVNLQRRICNALERGHSCDALCPWFFVDVQGKLPKKPWFRSASNVRVVEARLHSYQDLIDVIVTFINSPHNRSCCRAKDRVPAVLFDFLFHGVDLDPSIFKVTSPKNSRLSFTTQHRPSEPDLFHCSLCDDDDLDACARTTLPCRHSFHDDCILKVLNESPLCPQCAGASHRTFR
ncbi:hypothetical protein H310_06293 [Aphanomyces invadans]|uniref:RING-type domain-containing protein n=1 Tax=Aphanomyces invadans TaxID=157072 RepID=A0A024U6Z8_9STRA|nr:hypothetical protein H310_06293 [Aphanomyces invadans]ETW01672.1 hypothetical protein H310_06293 [Aphanomyces invadans]|eukprot:XP_008869520.1 hypothetical protein H310_06293 [Aphanomyces invadans]